MRSPLLLSRKLLFCVFFFLSTYSFAQVAIGTAGSANPPTPNPKAVLLLTGANQGLIIPIVNSKGSVNATSTEKGMVVFDDSDKNVYYFTGLVWNQVGGGSQSISINGNLIQLSGSPVTSFPLASSSGPAANQNGQLLMWNQTNSRWEATANTSTAINGMVLTWNGTTNSWEPKAPIAVSLTTLPNGQIFVGNASNVATATAPSTFPLSNFGAAAAAVSLGNNKITNLATPTAPTDGANKAYVDANVLPSLSASQLLSNNGSNVGITIAGDLSLAVAGTTGTFTIAPNAVTNAKLAAGIDAAKITTGTLPVAQVPSLDASKITSGTFTTAQIPNLDANKITTGTLATARIDVGTTANKIVQLDAAGKLPAVDGSQLTGLTGGGSVTNVTGTAPISVATGTSTPLISIAQANTTTNGYLSSADWNIFNAKQGTLSLTTTGTSGAATLAGNILNVPNYSATSYLAGTGLTLTTNTFSVNTSQNISTLSNLTTNGLIKTSGGTGALTIATAGTDYLVTETDATVKAINGLVKSNGTTISAATAGTDYLTPTGSAATLTGFPTFNQNTTGSAASFTGNLVGDVTGTQLTTVIGTGAVNSSKILDGTITGADLASNIAISTSGTLSSGATTVTGLTVSGATTSINGATMTWPAANGSGALTNNGSGNLTWVPAGGGGTVTSIAKGVGLVAGSAITTSGTIDVNVGTGANQIVQLDGTGKLPAIDGSQLLNLPAGTETDPTVKAINGLVKSNGTTISAAAAGTDYLTPTGSAASLTGFPTFNQNTTGSAASFTGALVGDVTGTQSATVVGKINGASLSALSTGLLKNTTGTGVPTIAVAGTDYLITETDATVKAINGLVKSNGTLISAATAGTDYLTPTGNASGLTGLTAAQIPSLDASKITTGTLPIAQGGTGAITAPLARAALGLGTLSTLNTVTTTEITDATITDADISATANIAGTKINPNFGNQNIGSTGTVDVNGPQSQFQLTNALSGPGLTAVGAIFTGKSSQGPQLRFQGAAGGAAFWDIGQDATGNFTFENTDAPTLQINNSGNVGIGTTTPTAKLDIAGTIKIVDGTQGAGKVLTSDAAGLATWTTVSGTGDMLKATYDANTDGIIDLSAGGTGANTAVAARTNLGLGTLATASSIATSEITDGTITGADLANNIAITTTGNISAANFTGNGSGLTGITATASGPAGGDLSGTYPNPTIGATATTGANIITSINAAATLINGARVNTSFGAQNISTTGTLTSGAITATNLASINGANYTWPGTNASGVLTNNGTGTLTWTPSAGLSSALPSTNIFVGNGSNIATGVAMSGDATISNTGALTITNNAITNVKIATGIDATKITAGTLPVAQVPNLDASKIATGALPVARGGTGLSSFGGGLLYASSPTVVGDIGNGTAGQMLLITGTSPSWQTMSGDATITGVGAFTIANSAITDAKVATGIAGSKIVPNFSAQNIVTTGTLTTGTAGAFAVDATGNITKIRNVTISFPAANAAGILTNDGAGTLSWAAGSGWGLTGNTLAGGEKLGSINGNPLPFITNNVERMRIDASGNVGIGTNAPNAPLQFSNTTANRKIVFYEGVNNDHQFIGLGLSPAVLRFQTDNSASDHVFYTGTSSTTSSELMRIKGTGNVGIGTTAPINKLDIEGGIAVGATYSGASTAPTNGAIIEGNVGIGTTTSNAPLQFSNTTANRKIVFFDVSNNDHQFIGLGLSPSILRFQTDNSVSDHVFFAGTSSTTSNELMRIKGNGNVGIGTATPASALEVNGQVKITGGTPGVGKVLTSDAAGLASWVTPSGGTLISNTGTNNLFAGTGVSTAGNDNAIFGINAGSTNSGLYNVIVGANAGVSKTTGDLNTLIGWYAGKSVSSAGDTFIGAQAGENTTGGPNTFIGEKSGRNTTTGTLNVFIGNSAAITNTTGDKSTIIGYGANVGATNLGNANAIGYLAYVTTGNSMVLGSINGVNGATADTNVGIGTTAPSARLEVAGQVKITGGTPGLGKVLTSDAAGLASWQAAGGGWGLTGNSGTVDGTNFMGTTDNIPLNFKVNNQKAGRIDHLLFNTFLGYQSGNSSTGANNAALGYLALQANTTGAGNAAFGSQALAANTTSNANTAIGYSALAATTGGFNTAVGNVALAANTSGANNTASGYQALQVNTTASGNAAFGSQALKANNGVNNAAFGFSALVANTAGFENTAVGLNSLAGNTNGNFNTAVGSNALFTATSSSTANVAVGYKALYSSTGGTNNTAIGAFADAGNTLSNATAIGYSSSVTTSNSLVLGGTGANAVKVGIGTTAPTTSLQVDGSQIVLNSTASYGFQHNYLSKQLATYIDANGGWLGTRTNDPLNFFTNNGTQQMTILQSGNVGIGTTTPSQKLDVNGNVNISNTGILSFGGVNVLNTSANSNDVYANLRVIRNASSTVGDGMYIGLGNTGGAAGHLRFYTNGVLRMLMDANNGMIGINNASPAYPLDVVGGNTTNYFSGLNLVILSQQSGSAYWASGNFIPASTGNSASTTIKASNFVVAEGFLAISDKRIKRDIQVSDASKDLQTLMKLKVSDYHFVDWVGRGSQLKKGFIAQEVKEIFPEAVSTKAKEIIPSVYAKAKTVTKGKDDFYSICTPVNHNFVVGDRIKLITPEGEIIEPVTSIEGSNCFSLKTNKISSPDQVIVYGKEINDFHSVDYDQVHTLSVSAIQELARKIEALEKENTDLKQNQKRMDSLQTAATAQIKKIAELESSKTELESLKSEIANIKRVLGMEAKATPNKKE